MDDKFKVSLYIRVSTGRQANEGDSLEEQESELKKFCEYKKYLIHKVHIERGRSAKDTNRPEYQKLISDIENEKINAVIVKKLDRLSRSLLDFEEFMKTAQKHTVEFISLKENFDTTTAMGKAMLRVALVFAQLEREQTAERIKDVFAYRVEQGLYNGGIRPYGYASINKELVPEKKEAKTIEIIFNKFLELKSTAQVTQFINSLGIRNRNGKLWDKRQIHKILRRPIYYGMVKWNEVLHKGIHQPIITEIQFQKVQDVFDSRKYNNPRNKVNGLLKGFLICGSCGNNLSPNYTQKKNGNKYYYYRCISSLNPKKMQCKNRYFSLKQVETSVFNEILEYSNEQQIALINKKITASNLKIEKEITALKTELSMFEQKALSIKTKKEKYLDSLIEKDFKPNERKMINEKLEELTLDDKQIKANIYRQQFDISNQLELLQTIDEFKEQLLFLKINFDQMTDKEIVDWLKQNITSIKYYSENDIEIDFKRLNIG